MSGKEDVKISSEIGGYPDGVPPMVEKNERTIYIGNALSIVKTLKWGEQNGFKRLDFRAENINSKFEFLTTMIFRSDIPDDLAMKIRFDRIQYLLYRKICNGIYGFIYIDDRDYLNYAFAYKKEGEWKFRTMKPNNFKRKMKKLLKFGMEVRE